MKHPAWILNFALLVTLLLVVVFVFSHWPAPIERVAIVPKKVRVSTKEIEPQTGTIIEKDLFGTFRPDATKEPLITEELFTIPEPPKDIQPTIPAAAAPQFLDPLPITLTGIVMTDDPEHNRAVIYHAHLKEEVGYKIGDKIEDAQLVRIFSHKVIIIRSNGQQETLYLNQEDAQADAPSTVHGYWEPAIKQIDSRTFIIDPTEFTRKVRSLAQFIEFLDLTWAYAQKQSVGARIGELEQESFGPLLGLNPGDIIESIAGISTEDETHAFEAYEAVIKMLKKSSIPVVINRTGTRFTITIHLDDIHNVELIMQQDRQHRTIKQEKSPEEMKQEKINLMHQRYTFAPTVQELEKQERERMWYGGRNGAVSPRLNTRNVISGI